MILDKILPHFRRKRLERYLSKATLEEFCPSAEEIHGAREFANYFDPTGEFGDLIELAATKPEIFLKHVQPWLSDARYLLKKIEGMDNKEKAHFLYHEHRLLPSLAEDYLLERNLAFVFDYDAVAEDLAEELSTLQSPGASGVNWPRLKEQMMGIDDTLEAMEKIAGFLRDNGLTISRLRNDPNDICVVIKTEGFPKIQKAALRGRLFDLAAE